MTRAGVLAQMAVDREPLYREVADVVVDVDGQVADEVADDVLEVVRRREDRASRARGSAPTT